jgi:hypothetical protein
LGATAPIAMSLAGCDSAPETLRVTNPKPDGAAVGKMAPVRIAPGTKGSGRGPSVSHDDY